MAPRLSPWRLPLPVIVAPVLHATALYMSFAFHDPADDAAPQSPYVHDRAAFDDAAGLIAQFGDDAGFQAAARAERSRNLGNAIDFCHWRQIERLIVLLATGRVIGTLH